MITFRRLLGPVALTLAGAALPLLAACGGSGTAPAVSTVVPAAQTAVPAAQTAAAPAVQTAAPAIQTAAPAVQTAAAPATKALASPSPAAKTAGSPSPSAGTTILVKQDPTLGRFLTDGSGRTLYKFARDTTPNTSACVDNCLQAWPPLLAPTGALTAPAGVTGTLAAFARPDGSRQVSYNGVPLYYYASDTQPGDVKGNGVGGNWAIVAP
jgi:predicted lipoprotein with Yx(FWY)xxD motif